jgi:hypothetical protein
MNICIHYVPNYKMSFVLVILLKMESGLIFAYEGNA